MLARNHHAYKFNAQSSFFSHIATFPSLNSYRCRNIPNNSFCCIFDEISALPNGVMIIPDAFLCECQMYGSNFYGITFIKRVGSMIRIQLPTSPPMFTGEGISLSLICTDTPLYNQFLVKCVDHYASLVDEICVAYFGEYKLNLPEQCRVQLYPKDQFSMSFARNTSLDLCTKTCVLMSDLDCYLSKDQLETLVYSLLNKPNDGVFSIQYYKNNDDFSQMQRHYRSGNGCCFGLRDVLIKNPYDERFKFFNYEDTAWLMNFSRQGIIPVYSLMNYKYDDHPRTATSPYGQTNKDLFEKILKNGR